MKKLIYTIVFLLTLISSCTSRSTVNESLARIDSLIETGEIDSARRLLDSINMNGASAEMMARHALLMSKIGEHSVPPAFNDSLLKTAVDFYRGRGDSLELQSQYLFGAYSQYYNPLTKIDLNSRFMALKRAIELSENMDDTVMMAKNHKALGSLYSLINNQELSAEHHTRAAELYMDIGCLDLAAQYFSFAARQLGAIGRDSLAVELLVDIKNIVDTVSDRIAIIEYNLAVSNLKNRYTTHNEALRMIEDAKKFRASNSANRSDKAQLDNGSPIYIRGTKKSDGKLKPICDSVLDMIIERLAWPDDSFSNMRADNIRTNFLTNPYTKLVDQYYRTEIDNHILVEKSSRRHINMLIAAVAFLIVSVIAIYLLYSRRLQDKQLQIMSLVNDIDRLRLSSTSKIHPYSLINKLCELRQNAPSSDQNLSIFGKNAARFVDNLNSKEVSDEIEQFVNSCRNNIMTKFRGQFPQLTPRQQKCMLLIFAGFSNRSIAALLNYPSDGAFRTERSRIKHIIEQSSAPDCDLFLDFLQGRNGL